MIKIIEKILRKLAIFFVLRWVASKSEATGATLGVLFDLLDDL